jgi:hypothetical protein
MFPDRPAPDHRPQSAWPSASRAGLGWPCLPGRRERVVVNTHLVPAS